ncbi:MAG: 4-hydroxybutyrate CoA-transferase, partial [Bacteroidales bacterium]|nr:4-hydroxybutyrate CoA-transferase [Bacteroidales bacterium]
MDWRKDGNFVTAEEAVKAIKDNDKVVFGHAAGAPQVVPAEMVKQMERLHGVEIFHMFTIMSDCHLTPETEGHFRHVTNFVAGNSRTAITEDRGDFVPLHFSEVPAWFDEYFKPDVTVCVVSRPDENGNC